MADSDVEGLGASGALTGTELFYADNGVADVKVTADQIKTFSGSKIKLLALTTFWYTPTGNDTTGDGSFGNPFASPQGAYEYCVHNIDANGWFIKLRDMLGSTYTASNHIRQTDEFSVDKTVVSIHSPIMNCPCVEFEGHVIGDPTIWDADEDGLCAFVAVVGGLWRFQSITFDSIAGPADTLLFGFNQCTIGFQECHWKGNVSAYHIHVGPLGVLKIFGDEEISGDAAIAHAFLETSMIDHEVSEVTFTGTPALGTYVYAVGGSVCAWINVTFVGTFTGRRFASENSSLGVFPSQELDGYIPGSLPGLTTISDSSSTRTWSRRVESLATSASAVAFEDGEYGTLVQVTNLGTSACALFFTSAGHTVTKVAGDASFEASTTPSGGNSGFGWGGANYNIYNNTGVTRSYTVFAHQAWV